MKKIISLIILPAFAIALAGMVPQGTAQSAVSSDANLQGSVSELGRERQAFKDAKTQEENERLQAAKETVQSKRKAVELRRAEAEKTREEKRKAILLKLIDIQVKHLINTNERVQKMPNISDTLKAKLKEEVDKDVRILGEEKAKVQAATGQDAIKSLAKEVRDIFKEHRGLVQKIVDAIHESRADKFISTAEERLDAVKTKIKELKDNGKITAELESKLVEAEKAIGDAKAQIGKKAFLEANDDLKGAYQKFRDIAQKAKGL